MNITHKICHLNGKNVEKAFEACLNTTTATKIALRARVCWYVRASVCVCVEYLSNTRRIRNMYYISRIRRVVCIYFFFVLFDDNFVTHFTILMLMTPEKECKQCLVGRVVVRDTLFQELRA